jgi:hypothetical protein
VSFSDINIGEIAKTLSVKPGGGLVGNLLF